MNSQILCRKLQSLNGIVIDSCVLKSPKVEDLLKFLHSLNGSNNKRVIFIYEDYCPPSCFDLAKQFFGEDCVLHYDFFKFIERSKSRESKKYAFIFSSQISIFKELIFNSMFHSAESNFLKLDFLVNDSRPALVDGDDCFVIEPGSIYVESNKLETNSFHQLFNIPSYKSIAPEFIVINFPEYKNLFCFGGAKLVGEVFDTKKHGKIQLGKIFGKDGGESVVYSVFGDGLEKVPMVAKIFRPEKLTTNKCGKLLRMMEKPINDPQIAWPLDVVLYRGKIIGYIRKDFGNSNLKEYISSLEQNKKSKIQAVEIAIKVCEIVAKVQSFGLVIGDLKPENFLLNKNPDGRFALDSLSIIDTDSFQIDEFPMPMITPPYASPLIYLYQKYCRRNVTYVGPEVDGFALSTLLLIIFLGFSAAPYLQQQGIDNNEYYLKYQDFVLNHILHPSQEDIFIYSTTSDAETYSRNRNVFERARWAHLPSPVKGAFSRCFNDFRKPLSAEEWAALLEKYYSELMNGNLLKSDEQCEYSFYCDVDSAEKSAQMPYKNVEVDWGDNFFYGSKITKSLRTPEQLKQFRKSIVCSSTIDKLLSDLSTSSNLIISEQERSQVINALSSDGHATFGVFEVKLLVDIGIAYKGTIERRN